MRSSYVVPAVAAAGLGCVLMLSGASVTHAQDVRQLGPHVHGDSNLDIAVDGKNLAMQLHSPGMDVFGFEHPATTDADKATAATATKFLQDPVALFGIPASAGCKASKADVQLVPDTGEDERDNAAPGAGAAAAAPEPPGGHWDVQVGYELSCTNLGAITGFNPTFFAKFPNSMQIEFDIVTGKGVLSVTSTRAQPPVSAKNLF